MSIYQLVALISLLIGTFGIIGNIGLIWIFMRRKPLLHFHALLITLASFDILFITTDLIVEMKEFTHLTFETLIWFRPFTQIALVGNILSTMTISIGKVRYQLDTG